MLEADIEEAKSIAKGAHQAVSFGNYETMVTALNSLPKDTYKIPQSIMIVTLNVPDLWVSSIAEESVAYTYVDDDTFANEIKTNGSVQIGYYVLSALETQKVDLVDYVKNTDYATGTKAGVMKVPGNTGVYMYEGKLWLRLATNYEIKNKTNYFSIAPERLDYAMKIGLTTNTENLTDEEKASALAWLGAVGKTEYAGEGKAGVIKTSNFNGNTVDASGSLYFYGIGGGEWKDRNKANYYVGNRVLSAKYVDNIVKYGLTDNQLTLTDEEKLAALKWLGVVGKTIKFSTAGTSVQWNNDGALYYQGEYTPTAEQLIGVSVTSTEAGTDTKYIIDSSRIIDNTADGITIRLPYNVFIFIAYTDNYTPSAALGRLPLPKRGMYFSWYDDGDTYHAKDITINEMNDNLLNLEGHPYIKALMARIEALENK